MAYQYLKAAGLSALLLGGACGVAQAATPTSQPAPSDLSAIIKPNADGSFPQRGGAISKGPKAAQFVLGWNFEVCGASQVISPSPSSFTVLALNTDGSMFLETTSATSDPIQNELVAACQNGEGGYWIEITSLSPLLFDSVLIYYP